MEERAGREKDFAALVERARSLEEIEAALRSRPDVKSAKLLDFLLKCYPPQRVMEVEIVQPDGSAVKKEIVFIALADGRFQFRELRDSATT